MSIANELSSEVATAVFTRTREKAELEPKGLTKVVLEVHSTLRRLMADARQRRRSQISQASTPERT
ncbi:MAG: hypothetical protein WCF57_13660 [Pyrinomonadaceae bacterium]